VSIRLRLALYYGALFAVILLLVLLLGYAIHSRGEYDDLDRTLVVSAGHAAANPCPSGHPFALIDGIQGRVEDVLSFPGNAGGLVNVHPLVFSSIMDTLPVSGWQVVQEADVLHVLLSGVRGEFEDEMLSATLRQALAEQGVIAPHVEVQRVESIPKTAAGKAPLIKSNLTQVREHLG